VASLSVSVGVTGVVFGGGGFLTTYKICEGCGNQVDKFSIIELPGVHDCRSRNYLLCDMCLRKIHLTLESGL